MWSCRCFPWLLMREILTAWLVFLIGWMLRVVIEVVCFFSFFFFSPSQSEYLHLFESISLPGKILVPTVHAYLGKAPRSRADLRGCSRVLNPCWVGDEVGATAGQSLLWLYQCSCRLDQDQQEKWRHPMAASTRVAGSVFSDVGCSSASSMFLASWMGVWAVGPLAAFSFF